MYFAEIDRRAWPQLLVRRKNGAGVTSELHQLSRRSESEQSAPRFGAQVMADFVMLLNERLPQVVVIFRHQIQRGRQTEIMAVAGKQLHAEAVDRSKECPIKGDLDFRRTVFLENPLSCPLLHFVRGAMGKRNDHKLWQ